MELVLNPNRPFVRLEGIKYSVSPADWFTENQGQYVFHFDKKQQHKNIDRRLSSEEKERIDAEYRKRELPPSSGLRRFQIRIKLSL